MKARRLWTIASLLTAVLIASCGDDSSGGLDIDSHDDDQPDTGVEADISPGDSGTDLPAFIITSEQEFVDHPAYVLGGTGELHNPHIIRGFDCSYLALRDLDFHFAVVDVTVDASDSAESAGIEVVDVGLRSGLIADSEVTGSRVDGIVANGAPGLRVVDTTVHGSGGAGIRLTSSPGASVAGCQLSDNSKGVVLDSSSNALVYHATIEGSVVGIEIAGSTQDAIVTDCDVADSDIGMHIADESAAFTAITNNRLRNSHRGVMSAGQSTVVMGNRIGPSADSNIQVEASAHGTIAAMNVLEQPGWSHVTDAGVASRWWIDGSAAWFERFIGLAQGAMPPAYSDVVWSNVYLEPSLCGDSDVPVVVETDVWGHEHRYRDDGATCFFEALESPRWLGPRSYMH